MIAKHDRFANTDHDHHERTASGARIAVVAAVAMLSALIVNAIIRVVAVEGFDASSDDDPMVWGAIVASTIIVTAVAALVYWALGRFTERPVRTFTIVAAVAFVISLFGPLATPDIDTASRVAAIAMHVAVAGIVVGMLTVLAREG